MGYKGKTTVAASGVRHNPPPRTPRGKRRHDKRDDGAKKHAEKMWAGG